MIIFHSASQLVFAVEGMKAAARHGRGQSESSLVKSEFILLRVSLGESRATLYQGEGSAVQKHSSMTFRRQWFNEIPATE